MVEAKLRCQGAVFLGAGVLLVGAFALLDQTSSVLSGGGVKRLRREGWDGAVPDLLHE